MTTDRRPDPVTDHPGWCDEAEEGHQTEDGHMAYLLTEHGENPRSRSTAPATVQVVLAGHEMLYPRLGLVLIDGRSLRHLSILLTPDQVKRLRVALDKAEHIMTSPDAKRRKPTTSPKLEVVK